MIIFSSRNNPLSCVADAERLEINYIVASTKCMAAIYLNISKAMHVIRNIMVGAFHLMHTHDGENIPLNPWIHIQSNHYHFHTGCES